MRVLLSGGCKTESIINTIKSKFDSSGDELFHVNYINNINDIYQRGNYFDKAIIVDQSITKDHSIDNENKLRERINRFAFECANRGRNEIYMFLTGNEELANIIHEETLAIRQNSVIILKDGPYAVKFFANLIIADISQIPDKLIFKPKEVFNEMFDTQTEYEEDETYVPDLGEPEEEPLMPLSSFDNMNGETNIGAVRDDFTVNEGEYFGENYDNEGNNFDNLDGNNYDFDSLEDRNEESFEDLDGNNYDFDNLVDNNEESFEDLGDSNGNNFDNFGNELNEFENTGDDSDYFDDFGQNGETFDNNGIDSEIVTDNDFDTHTEKSGDLPDFTYTPPADNEDTFDNYGILNDSEEYTGNENQGINEDIFGDYDQNDQDYQEDTYQGDFGNQDYQDDFGNQDYQDDFQNEQTGEFDNNEPYNGQDINGFSNPGSYRQADEPENYGMMNDAAALAIGGIAAGMAAGSNRFNEDDYGNNSHSIENYNNQVNNNNNQQGQYMPGGISDDDYTDLDNYRQENGFTQQNYENPGYNQGYNQQMQNQQVQQQVQPQKKGLFGRGKNKQQAQQNQQISIQGVYNQQTPQPQNFGGNIKALAKDLASFAPRGNNICVTGTSGSGVSTISLNLANVLANMGFNVLLVDLDTYGKSQSYLYRSEYADSMSDLAHTRMAINSRGKVADNTVVLKQGLHLMSMGIGVDSEKPEKILEKTRLGAFINNVKREYNFVIYDTPFDLLTSTFKDLASLSDNLVMVVETSTHGLVKTMLSMCNLSDDDLTSTLFNKSQVVFNKERGLKKLLGMQVKTAQSMLEILDDKLQEITGEDYGIYFSEMNIAGIIKDNPDYELAWFEEIQMSDTPAGKEEYARLAHSIITRKR